MAVSHTHTKEKIMGYFSELDIQINEAKQANKPLTTMELIAQLKSHFNHTWEMQETVAVYRKQNPSWNWVDAATALLNKLEGMVA
jgi:hypothetical protein